MEYSQLLDLHIVPEWRNQYINYSGLRDALNEAIDSKRLKSKSQSQDLYSELIKFDQTFAEYFQDKCFKELDKVATFHKEKLLELRGKYRNLEDQLYQLLASAAYRNVEMKTEKNCLSSKGLFKAVSKLKDKIGSSSFKKENGSDSIDEKDKDKTSHQRNLSITKLSLENFDIVKSSDFDTLNNNNNQSKTASYTSKSSPFFITKNQLSFDSTNSVKSFDSNQINYANPNIAFKTKEGKRFSLASISLTEKRLKDTTITKSWKKKLSNLKFAYRELYFSLVLFEQYTELNYAGFKHILRKYDRMFASTAGRKFFQDNIQTIDFYNDLDQIDQLIEGVEHLYTVYFESSNRQRALDKLQIPSSVLEQGNTLLDFKIGFELGTFLILFILVLICGCSSHNSHDWRIVFRLYRAPMLLIIFLLQTGISLVIWKHYKINHVLIFELNPRNNLTYHNFFEFASLLGIVWSASVLLFLHSTQLNIKPSLCPLVVTVLVILYIFNPTVTCHYQARFWLLKHLVRIFTAPFHKVRFADFWLADQLVSIIPIFLDLEYLACFYTTDDVLSVSHLSKEYSRRCVTRNTQDLVIRTIVAAFPAWTRCAQCLRRWRDENWRTHHLCNALKYSCMVTVVVLSSLAQYNKTGFEFDTMRIVWIVFAVLTSALTAYWDVIYDFGLFNATKSKNSHPLLRDKLVYPAWVYYFAILEDWILRFGWIFTISLTEFSGIEAGLVVSLLAPLEMFRRFVWNCIRLENEQLNNCGLFREVRDIPLEVVAPINESHLKKVIIMMDSKDGVPLRDPRMMKRNNKDRYNNVAEYDIVGCLSSSKV